MRFDVLFQFSMMGTEAWLCDEQLLATAGAASSLVFEAFALCFQFPTSWPQTSLPDYNLHPLKLSRHGRMCIQEIEVIF